MSKTSSKPRHKADFVTVIIPTFNAAERLLLLLKSLENQSDRNFEVIVVDDGSNDGTREAVAELTGNFPVPLRYYYLNNTNIFGAGISRNYGAKHAKGSILLFLDQDCVAEKNLIMKHFNGHKTKDVILGYYAGYRNEREGYKFLQLKRYVQGKGSVPVIKEFRDQLFREENNKEAWKCFVSAHFSIKRNIFLKFCFDESFRQWGCEDVDLGYRLFQKRKAIHFVKECVAYNSSQKPRRTKKKFLSLSASLIHMYKKYQTEDIKQYCFERFYHIPLKYRGSLQLIFKNNSFKVQKSQTKIVIGESCRALVVAGADFVTVASTVESIVPLIKSIHFDVAILKGLEKSALLDFQKSFHRLIKILRKNKKNINLDDIRKQTFLMGIRLVGPKLLVVDFYNRCNAQCLFCPTFTPLKNKKIKHAFPALDLAVAQKILDQAYEMGVEKIRVSSDGEPLLSDNALPILRNIAQKGFKLQLLTNGTMLKNEHLVSLSKITEVEILMNFSASRKTTYRKIHGGHPDNHDLVLRSLSRLFRLKQMRKKHNESFVISTTYIITKLNYHEISEYVLLVKRLGVDHVYFKFALPHEQSAGILVSVGEIQQVKKELLKAGLQATKYFLSTNINNLLSDIDNKRFRIEKDAKGYDPYLPSKYCYNGWFFGRINSEANYYICCRETVPVENINKNSLKNIFFSDKMKDLLDEGASGVSLEKSMWSKCNFCYHLATNREAEGWLT